jgi:hypothetical protein
MAWDVAKRLGIWLQAIEPVRPVIADLPIVLAMSMLKSGPQQQGKEQ